MSTLKFDSCYICGNNTTVSTCETCEFICCEKCKKFHNEDNNCQLILDFQNWTSCDTVVSGGNNNNVTDLGEHFDCQQNEMECVKKNLPDIVAFLKKKEDTIRTFIEQCPAAIKNIRYIEEKVTQNGEKRDDFVYSIAKILLEQLKQHIRHLDEIWSRKDDELKDTQKYLKALDLLSKVKNLDFFKSICSPVRYQIQQLNQNETPLESPAFKFHFVVESYDCLHQLFDCFIRFGAPDDETDKHLSSLLSDFHISDQGASSETIHKLQLQNRELLRKNKALEGQMIAERRRFEKKKADLDNRLAEALKLKDSLQSENKEYLKQLNDKKAIYQQMFEENSAMQSRYQKYVQEHRSEMLQKDQTVIDLRGTIKSLNESVADLQKEKADLQNRLSRIAGDKLTTGNPAITDLGDKNRPMRIGDQYIELYDNEWTDALDFTNALKNRFPKAEAEEIVVKHLYRILVTCYKECVNLSEDQLKNIAIKIKKELNIESDDNIIHVPGVKQIKDNRRYHAKTYALFLFKNKVLVDKILQDDWEYAQKDEALMKELMGTKFFEKCIDLCWHMVTQETKMYLDNELSTDTIYDKTLYREFTKSGDKVSFVVWPTLFLHKGGPLLVKGVVQAYT